MATRKPGDVCSKCLRNYRRLCAGVNPIVLPGHRKRCDEIRKRCNRVCGRPKNGGKA